MADRKLFEADHPRAAPGKLGQRRAAHGAEPHHDHIVFRHRSTRLSAEAHLFTVAAVNCERFQNPWIGVGILAGMLAFASPASAQSFSELARSAGTPQIPGLKIVYLVPLGNPADAPWKNIIAHQTEGPANSARALAAAQNKNPGKRARRVCGSFGLMRDDVLPGRVGWIPERHEIDDLQTRNLRRAGAARELAERLRGGG